MHQVYLWCVLYVFCVLYGSRCEIQFYLISWLQTIIRFSQSEIYIYVVQFIFNFELKYNEIAAVYMYIYIVYINDIVKSYILPLINHEPILNCILLFFLASDDNCDS